MPVDMLAFYAAVGHNPRISKEKTAEVKKIIKGLDQTCHVVVCIRSFLNHYPEEGLLEFCFQRFFEVRPRGSGPKYRVWENELRILVQSLRRARIEEWEHVFFEKCMAYYPTLAREIWPEEAKKLS